MDILVLGGTAWLGRTVARQAIARGHTVTCLARGASGEVAVGAELVVGDRDTAGAYDALAQRSFDAVVDVSWQPRHVRGALAALGARARHWTYVSSGSVYADPGVVDGDESDALLEPTPPERDLVDREEYGPAKVACERWCSDAVDDRLLVVRSGLIGGPGDASDRLGAWVARAAADPRAPMLVPDSPAQPTQVVDVRDLADWVLDCAERGVVGTYDAVGPIVALGELVATAREVGGHTGAVVLVDPGWLREQGVAEFMGPDSVALWLGDPDWQGFMARSGAAASAAGLRHRTVRDLLADTLAWERELGLERARRAGLSPRREADLLAAWAQHR